MSVNFNSAPMRSKAIASLDHASFRVYYVLQQHCVELRSTRIAAPSFTQLHSAIAPECGGISIGMFRKSLLSLESAGFLKLSTNGRVKIFDLLGVRESYPDVDWFDRAVLILEESEISRSTSSLQNLQSTDDGRQTNTGEGLVADSITQGPSSSLRNLRTPDDGLRTNSAVGVSTSLPAHDSSIRNHQSSLLAAPPDAGLRTNSAADENADAVGSSSETPGLRTPDAGLMQPWRSQGSGLLHARGHDNVVGSSSDSSALQAPDTGLVGVIHELPSSQDPNSSIINPQSSMSAAPSASSPASEAALHRIS